MPSIDLNCDLGESFGAYTIGMDAEILPYITSANIACGFHAGDPSVMQKSVLLCKKYGVQVGAHPGLPDLQGFGRRKMAISPAEAETDVMYQIGALKAFCEAAGALLHHVKPHGALYNMAAKDPALAAAICRAVQAAAPGAVLLALCLRTLQTGLRCPDALGCNICVGIFAALFLQCVINLGMNLQVLPVIGVTLPFFSAGGSSVVMMYLCIGIVLSVGMNTRRSKLDMQRII